MSVIFRSIRKYEIEDTNTFSMSDAVYEVLIGDSNFPMTPDGGLPAAIAVPLMNAGMLLSMAGYIDHRAVMMTDLDGATEEERDEWMKEWEGSEKLRLAVEQLLEDKEMACMLWRDYTNAVREGHGAILYQ